MKLITAVALMLFLSITVLSGDSVQYANSNDEPVFFVAFEDGSSLMVLARETSTTADVTIVYYFPDGALQSHTLNAPGEVRQVIVCKSHVQIFGYGIQPWRYVWDLPVTVRQTYLPVVCK